MTKALITLSSLLVAVGAFAQGAVNFSAKVAGATGYTAPVYLDTVGGPNLASGAAYMVQLYAGTTATSLSPVGAALPFRTGAAAGLWFAEGRTIPAAQGGAGTAFVQFRAWSTAAGATSYEQALAAGAGTGLGNIVSVVPTSPPGVPTDLTGITSFAITGIVPEPSIMALGALGGLALLLRRRK